MKRAPRTIEVRIEELVLHGFAPGDRQGIAQAVERELARLLARDGAPEAWRDGVRIERIDAGSFRQAPGAAPRRTGAELARTVWKGVRP